MAVLILHVIDFHVRMIFGGIGHLLESEPIETVGHREDTFAHGVNGEVRPYFSFVKGEITLAHLLCEVIVVPGGDFEIVAKGVAELLHGLDLFGDLCLGGNEYLHQQFLCGLGGLGHLVCGHIGREILVAKQGGFLGALLENLVDDRTVVVVAGCGVGGVSFPHLLAEVAVVSILQHGQAAGGMEGEYPFSFFSAFFGFSGGIVDGVLGKTGQISLVLHDNLESVVGVQ